MRIARESIPFAVPLAGLTGLLVWLAPPFAVLPLAALAFTLWFFRDPERKPPDGAGILAPADGRIIQADQGRISIFMNVFNVHVCRTPVAGTVRSVEHHAGRFLAAFKPEAPEQNERVEVIVDGGRGPTRFVLVAGLVARRIVPWIRSGQVLAAGDRVGLIRFGSRVDVYLPESVRPRVACGEKVTAGESVLAEPAGGA